MMRRLSALGYAVASLLAAASPCLAQNALNYPTAQGNTRSPGMTMMCLNTQGISVPLELCDSWPSVVRRIPGPDARAGVVTISPFSGGLGQYQAGATPITGNSTGTTGAVVGTLPAIVNRLTYICGFNVSSLGGTAATGPITIAGLVGSSMIYHLTSSATGTSITQTFTPCIPASAVNTAITITTTANGTASAVDVNSWGFQQ